VTIETVELGRDAVRRHAWIEAMEALAAADRERRLSPDDLELLGNAAWWAGHPDEATDALERAFAGYEDGGRRLDAARIAVWLAYQAFRRLAIPVGTGWQARAQEILETEPESATHAWLHVYGAFGMLVGGQIEAGIELTERAIDIARRHGNPDARFMATSFKGYGEVMAGRWQSGLAHLDEAAAAASSGELDLRVASDIYCNTMAACRNLGDLERASQWATEGERWMRRQSLGGYPGVCRVHLAEMKMLRGQWPEAEQEARLACQELQRYRLLDALGYAYYQIGEVRLRMGDFDGAAQAFDHAYEYGDGAQPGLARLQLARGEIGEARQSIARALAIAAGEGGVPDRATRGRLLPAQVEIALAAGDTETARQAVEELESIAKDFDRALFRAGALTARGELLLGEQKPADASPVLGQSWRLWQTTNLPYEAARARLRYAEALAAEGDTGTARRDLVAVRAAFERLGATIDLRKVDELLGEAAPAGRSTGPRISKTFMFTDIVTSTDLIGLIGDEAWSELLRWHDREFRSAIAAHHGEEVNHTGDGFFAAFEHAGEAVECAVDIQRRLARHRREHGFAPSVRVGLHTAEATRQGRNYSGQGVHVAARIGAAASSGEILATSSVLAGVGAIRFPQSEPRSLTLKGVREPVEARSIDWR
jgi:class 3 adenylate cyclase